jgi:hypothetical protein
MDDDTSRDNRTVSRGPRFPLLIIFRFGSQSSDNRFPSVIRTSVGHSTYSKRTGTKTYISVARGGALEIPGRINNVSFFSRYSFNRTSLDSTTRYHRDASTRSYRQPTTTETAVLTESYTLTTTRRRTSSSSDGHIGSAARHHEHHDR